MKSRKFVPQIFAESWPNRKNLYLAINKLFAFFRANYTHKREVKCTASTEWWKYIEIMDLKIRRHNTLLFNLSLLHHYFSQHYYFTFRTFFCLSGSAGKKTSYILWFSGWDLRFLRTTCPGNASWSFFWNKPAISSPSVGSK